jgi:ACS family D-galactonate transporter-like MFS transporter
VLLSGWVSDLMVKKGLSLGTARKLPIIIGLAMTVFMLGANYTDSSALVIVFMSIAFFGNGFARSPGRWYRRWHRNGCWV